MREIEVKDVGPVERLTIPVPEGGGWVILRGRNGSGKSSAAAAVQSLLGHGRPVSRDGSLGASVEGLGARLSIARRASRAGEVEVAHLEGEDPSLLVDPGLKDPAAADAERIRALCRLARVELDPIEAFGALVGGETALRELCRESTLELTDVPSLAGAVKRDIEAAARKSEQEATNLSARASGALRTLDDMVKEAGCELWDSEFPPSSQARAEHEQAVAQMHDAQGSREATERLLRAASEAGKTLQELGNRGTQAALEDAEHEHSLAEHVVQEASGSLERAKEALRQAMSDLSLAQQNEQRLDEVRAAQHSAARQREQLERTVAEAEGVTVVSDDELARLRSDVDRTRSLVEASAIVDRSAGLRGEAERLQEQARAAELRGSELRHSARSTERVVTDAVSRICPDDLLVHEGRLMVRHARGLIPFAELSQGERWRRALDIAVASVGEGGLLVVRQEAFEGLDPANFRAIGEHARSRRTVLLAAEATDGELRAEVEA